MSLNGVVCLGTVQRHTKLTCAVKFRAGLQYMNQLNTLLHRYTKHARLSQPVFSICQSKLNRGEAKRDVSYTATKWKRCSAGKATRIIQRLTDLDIGFSDLSGLSSEADCEENEYKLPESLEGASVLGDNRVI